MELSQRFNLEQLPQREEGLDSLIDDHFNLSPDPSTPLADTGLTSLDMIELAVRIEERFGVLITESVYEQCETVGDLAAYIEAESSAEP